MTDESITILKYCLKGDYMFKVMDKFDEADEPKRLDEMISWSQDMEDIHHSQYKQIWIKTCPIFAIS